MKKAFITGIAGQDGSYLAEFLLSKGYEVHGTIRRSSVFTTERVDHIFDKIKTYYSDLTDSSSLNRLLEKIHPDEIYNLGAQSHVAVSFEVPEYTAEVDGIGTLRLLDAIRETRIRTKFYQASSSEIFGGIHGTSPQNEKTPFTPRSPYGAAKLYAYWITVNYREAYNIFACNGILFNHESERRGGTFVTRKATTAIAKIKLGLQDKLVLGNLDAKRDWGYAPEFVEAMWLMLNAEKPEDYVIATGEAHSVRELCEEAFSAVGIEIVWKGKGIEEKGIDAKTGKILVELDPRYLRPTEVCELIGDASKAYRNLGWKAKTKFKDLIRKMVEFDFKILNKN